MQDNQKKYRKKYAVMTVFFLISASFLFGCGNKDSAVPETEEFLFSAEEEKSDHTSQKSEEPAEKAERKKAEADSGTVEENPERKKVFVYVCGEVQASGVYELEQDSRVFFPICDYTLRFRLSDSYKRHEFLFFGCINIYLPIVRTFGHFRYNPCAFHFI